MPFATVHCVRLPAMFSIRRITFAFCLYGFPVVIAVSMVLGAFGPLHASCKIDWTFQKSCADVNGAVADQMKKWESADNCKDGGEKCLYKMKSRTETKITGTHETPKKHYVDDLTFDFKEDGNVCQVHGYSTSETWYAVLDYGTNYCNLHNLITGSGLDRSIGYTESTSDSVCTQYSSADCNVY